MDKEIISRARDVFEKFGSDPSFRFSVNSSRSIECILEANLFTQHL